MNDIALPQQKLGEIGSVLARYTSDESGFSGSGGPGFHLAEYVS
jgi:hypothetical protein